MRTYRISRNIEAASVYVCNSRAADAQGSYLLGILQLLHLLTFWSITTLYYQVQQQLYCL